MVAEVLERPGSPGKVGRVTIWLSPRDAAAMLQLRLRLGTERGEIPAPSRVFRLALLALAEDVLEPAVFAGLPAGEEGEDDGGGV